MTQAEENNDVVAITSTAEAIAKVGKGQVVHVLARLVDSEDSVLRRAGVHSLGVTGSQDAKPWVLAALDDPDPHVITPAIGAVKRLQAQEAVPKLVELLNSPLWIISAGAANALIRLGDHTALAAMRDAQATCDHPLGQRSLGRSIKKLEARAL
jgi:HEAT repeat protein